MPIKRTFLMAALVVVPTTAIVDGRSAQAQVLNTRPLSQPYVNPSNPNAGEIGSRTSPGWREVAPGQDLNRGFNQSPLTLQKRGTCWTDSLGHQRCQSAR
jgi:hypothetical protein